MNFLNFEMMYQIIIINLSVGFVSVILFSLFRNRSNINFSQILMREDRISKVGIGFIFVMMLVVYQTLTDKEIDGSLVQLLMVIFGAEITGKWVDTRSSSNDFFDSEYGNTRKRSRRPLDDTRKHSEMDVDDINNL